MVVLERLANRRRMRYAPFMTYTAVVENDAVKLPPVIHLPDGTRVTIEAIAPLPELVIPTQSFAERYAEFIGMWEDGPTDLAEPHDHYASGAPKRKP